MRFVSLSTLYTKPSIKFIRLSRPFTVH